VAKEWVDELIRKQIDFFEVEEKKGEEKIVDFLEPKVQAADGKFSEQTLYCFEPECDSPFEHTAASNYLVDRFCENCYEPVVNRDCYKTSC